MKHVYLIYRTYNEKERPRVSARERNVLYGWSNSKHVMKVFMAQRSSKKFKAVKIDKDDINCNILDENNMIDYVSLKSESGNTIDLFLTKNELVEAERSIKDSLKDLCRLVDRNKGKPNTLELYMNLNEMYLDPLQFLGFIPPELEILFPSIDEYRESNDSMFDIDNMIDGNCTEDISYDSSSNYTCNFDSINDITDRINYSAETFIRAMKNNM